MSAAREAELRDAIARLDAADARGERAEKLDSYEADIQRLKRQIIKERKEKKLPVHPALQFGPISMTVASMAVISLGLSVLDLPREMRAFFMLFSRMTIVAVVCLVSYTGVIWYGYNQAISEMPVVPTEAEIKLAKFLARGPPGKNDRPDVWAHTRSHPSAFLTTRMAAPRLFPFPMGKTRPEATVKDELWWEGGNAPHVGHFNKPKLPQPPQGPNEETLLARVKKGMEIDKQRAMWKRRIREIQYLSCIVIVYFVNNKIAILALCYLIYTMLARELDNMLKPPTSMDDVYSLLDTVTHGAPKNQSAPKGSSKPGKPPKPLAGGMTYIYDPSSADRSGLEACANIPVVQVPAHVLMTTENSWYAGPGDPVKKE